ncbi:MAG: hypothetical protein EBV03_02535 [Proteobacteria bacterium]|nr:hypothetical protein [Pseudomonadota bacterium]
MIYSLLALALARLAALGATYSMDDAFITYRYARNLASGHGLVFHAGERVLGTTTPLYAFLCAGIYRLGFALERAMPLINIGIEMLLLAQLCRHVLLTPASRLTFATLLILSPLAGRLCANGMETQLFMLLVAQSLIWSQQQKRLRATLLASLACLCRPEALLALALLLVQLARARAWRSLAACAALAGVVMAATATALYGYYGHVLPLSMRLKAYSMGGARLEVIKLFFAFDPVSPLATLLAAAGLCHYRRFSPAQALLCAFGAAYMLAYLTAAPAMSLWYAYPALITLMLCAATAIARAHPALPPAAAACAALFWLALYPRLENVDGIRNNLYGDMRQWCQATHPKTIMACDVGRIGYYCDESTIYDICGLVWEHIAEKYQARTPLAAVIAEIQPEYLLLNPIASYMNTMRETPGYTLQRRFSADGKTQAEIGTGYTQDYRLEYYLFHKNAAP